MKCVNCGADVSGSKCEYCGTAYSRSGENRNDIKAIFSAEPFPYGQLQIGKETLNVYITDVEIRDCKIPSYNGRNIDGKITADKLIRKRKFTMIEI